MKTITILLMLLNACTICIGQQKTLIDENVNTQNTSQPSPFAWGKVDKNLVAACKPITKEQLNKVDSISAVIFKEYEKMNEYPEALEFVYADTAEYAALLLNFVSIEKLCCPSFTFYIKFFPDNQKVSLIIGGSSEIKELVKEYIH